METSSQTIRSRGEFLRLDKTWSMQMIEEIEVRKERVREGQFNGEDGKRAREERK